MGQEDKTREELIVELNYLKKINEQLKASFNQDSMELTHVEKFLKENETKRAFIADIITDVVWLMDLQGKSLFVSPSITNFTGYSINEYMTQTINERHTPASAIVAIRAFESEIYNYTHLEVPPIDSKKILVLDYCCKDGRIKTGEVLITPYFDEKMHLIGLYGVTRDITERTTMKNALNESNALFQSILNASPDLIVVIDLNGTIQMASSAALPLFDVDAEINLVGHNMFEFVSTVDIERVKSNVLLMMNNPIGAIEYQMIRPNGSLINVEVNGDVLRNSDGSPISMIFIIRDITERKCAEENLLKTLETLNNAQKIAQTGSWELNVKNNVFDASDECLRIFGFPLDFKPTFHEVRESFLPDDRARAAEILSNSINTRIPYSIEIQIAKKDTGEIRTILSKGEARYGIDDSPIAVVGTNQDITDSKRAELLRIQQLSYTHALNEIAELIINNNFANEILENANRIIGETLQLDRGLIYDVSFQDNCIVGLCEWLRLEHPDIEHTNGKYPLSMFISPFSEILKSKKYIESYAHDVNKHFVKDGSGKILHEQMKIKSLIWYPFAFDSHGFYVFTLNQIIETRKWSTEEINFLDAVAKQLSIALIKIKLLEDRNIGELLLKESNSNYQFIVENTDDILWTMNPDLSFDYISPTVFKFLGYTVDEHLKQTLDEFLTKDSVTRITEEFKKGMMKLQNNQYLDFKNNVDIEVEFIRKDKTHGFGLINLVLILDEQNQLKKIRGVTRDITDRKQAEESLQDLIDKNPLSIQIVDKQGFTIKKNEAHTLLFGVEPPPGFSIFDDLMSKSKLLKRLILRAQKGEVIRLPDLYYNVHDISPDMPDNPRWIRALIFPLKSSNGNSERFVLMHENITERKLAEDSLQESEERFRAVSEYSFNSICILNESGKMLWLNDAMTKMGGYSKEQFYAADSFVNFIAPQSIDFVFSNFMKFVNGENYEHHYNFCFVRADGEIRLCEKYMTDFRNQNGARSLVISMMDITEHKQAEEALKASEDKYRTMIEYSNDLIWTLDKNGNFTFLNEIALKTTGLNLEDCIGKSFVTQILDEDLPEIMTIYQKTMNGEVCSYELRFRKNDNNIVKILVNTSPIYISGKIEGIVSFGRDITESKKAEKQISLLGKAVEQSPVTVIITDKRGSVEFVNSKFTEITGYAESEILGKNMRILQSGKQTKEFYEELWNTLLSKQNWHGEFHNKKKNGDLYWESATISSILDNSGNISFFVAVKEDITEKKKLLEELIEAKEHAEESDRLKSAFLANMSHEIRTPMNGILGFADLLKEPKLTGEEQHEYISIIEESGERMLNIINDIISISKVESGQMDIFISETNINEQIDYIYTFFKPEAEQKGIKLLFKKSLLSIDANIFTDREKVYAVLINLVKNAIKFTNTGFIEFGYELKSESASDAQLRSDQPDVTQCPEVEFFVKDTGLGIRKDQQQLVFERFRQANDSLTRNYEGAGLGLSISKAYVEMLGGKIWVESTEGAGSTFYFTLPFDNETTEQKNQMSTNNVEEEIHQIKNLKILIAEDDDISEIFMCQIVKLFSNEILKVKTGIDAVKACFDNPDIDLILMDVKMPEMDGYEATRQIRKLNKDVIIIAQTAFGLAGDRDIAIEAGCNDYISKPVKKVVLLELLKKYFDK
ncbi:MAG: PAS domain S-box protein [Bacteroidota bacterium]